MTSIALITGATGGIGRAGGDGMAWRLGDGAACITGQVIAVDGRFTPIRPLVKQAERRPKDPLEPP